MDSLQQVFSVVSAVYTALLSVVRSVFLSSMTTRSIRDPASYTASEKKETLRGLHRQARRLDKKWSLSCKPDEYFLLNMIPILGDSMSTILAIKYLREIHRSFALPPEIENKFVKNVVIHAGGSIVPLVGWLFRRVFGVNMRNYRILEKYVMSVDSNSRESIEADSVTGLIN
ncbi:hypothetical protein EV180_005666 [Coemansia sp. RSA 518]|nr:hypothetical protein IW142_001933 [Coemansia sp. RSA 564]KAJ2218610.1 hypothetical protein EV180_005666 [Coemansia sp. RSA 518]